MHYSSVIAERPALLTIFYFHLILKTWNLLCNEIYPKKVGTLQIQLDLTKPIWFHGTG